MSALSRSMKEEADKIVKRGCVWVKTPYGKWYHTYNKSLVREALDRLLNYRGYDESAD